MFSLFSPKEKTKILQNSGVADCYLMAALDCLMNSGSDGLNLVKSLFTETEEGIIVRIKHNYYSDNLKDKDLSRYQYRYDPETDEDVFFISKEKCIEIDKAHHSAHSDALSVKILERIVPYYYYNNWQSVASSIDAYSIGALLYLEASHKKSVLYFLSRLLSFDIREIEIDHLPLLQSQLPSLAIYIAMRIHNERHAYRLERYIQPDAFSAAGRVALRNPWYSQEEIHDLSSIRNRASAIFLVNADHAKYQLACKWLDEYSLETVNANFAHNLTEVERSQCELITPSARSAKPKSFPSNPATKIVPELLVPIARFPKPGIASSSQDLLPTQEMSHFCTPN